MTNKYQVTVAPGATTDGTGLVELDIQAVTGADEVIPDRATTITIPEDKLIAALALGSQQAIVAAVRALIAAALPVGWSNESLDNLVNANAASSAAASDLDEYITVTLGQAYPISFVLN